MFQAINVISAQVTKIQGNTARVNPNNKLITTKFHENLYRTFSMCIKLAVIPKFDATDHVKDTEVFCRKHRMQRYIRYKRVVMNTHITSITERSI